MAVKKTVKVKPVTPVKYKGQRYEIGQELEVDVKDYEYHKNLYEVVGAETGDDEDDGPKKVILDDIKMPELKEIAKEKGIEGYSDMKKQELIDAIMEADSDGDNGGSEE